MMRAQQRSMARDGMAKRARSGPSIAKAAAAKAAASSDATARAAGAGQARSLAYNERP
jgi:hypothetical protein